jgi:hypothetical protein
MSLATIESFSLKNIVHSEGVPAKSKIVVKKEEKKVKVTTVIRWVKPIPNVHLLTMKFMSKLLIKLGDTRSKTTIVDSLVKRCPGINFVEEIRRDIIDCKVMIATVKPGDEINKKLNIGCLKNVLERVAKSCPAELKNSSANYLIQKAYFNINNIKRDNLQRFQNLARVTMKRSAILLRVYQRSIQAKLDKVLAEMKRQEEGKKAKKIKKAVPKKVIKKKAATKPKKQAAKKAKKTPKNVKIVNKVKPLPKRLRKLLAKIPANNEQDLKFIKDAKFKGLRSSSLSSYVAKMIKKLASLQ